MRCCATPLYLIGEELSKQDKSTTARTRKRHHKGTESPRKKQHLPNILVTGTPGTGKTRLSGLIAEKLGLKHIDGGDRVIENECYSGLLNAYICVFLSLTRINFSNFVSVVFAHLS